MEQEQLWGRRSWRAEMMQCGSKKPLRDKNHGLFAITALKEQRGSEHLQPAPGVVSITLQGCFQGCLDFFLLFFKCKNEWGWVFFPPQEKCLLSKYFFFFFNNVIPSITWNGTCFNLQILYVAYYIGHNRSTLCNHLHGPCTPLSSPGLFLRDVLWLLRTYSLCQDGSSTPGKAPWQDPVHRASNTQIPTSTQQNTHSLQAKYFRWIFWS